MKWVDVVINGLPEGQFLINNAVKIYASTTDVVNVEAARRIDRPGHPLEAAMKGKRSLSQATSSLED